MDGVQARPPKNSKYNNGNVPFELLIQHNTIITNLGKYEALSNTDVKPTRSSIDNVFNTLGRISKKKFYLYLIK